MPEEAKFISVLEAALLLHLVFSSQTFFFPQNPAYYLYPSLINNPPLPPFRLFCTCVGMWVCVCVRWFIFAYELVGVCVHVDGSAPSPCVPSLNGITGVAVAPHAESNRENKGQENERNDKTHTEHDGCEHEDTLSFSIQRKESGSCSTFFFSPQLWASCLAALDRK